MKRILVAILLALMLMVVPVSPVFALDPWEDEVEVTATPEYISIEVIDPTPAEYDFGPVATSATPYTTINFFTVDNTSSVVTDVKIYVTGDWTGGSGWTHADDGNPGDKIAGLYAGKDDEDDLFDVIVKKSVEYNLIADDQEANTDWYFGLKLYAPTIFYDGVEKVNTVKLTASKGGA